MIGLQSLLWKEIERETTEQEWLKATCNQYLAFYNSSTPSLITSLQLLLAKYNSNTILSFIPANAAPLSCVHIALVHGLGSKELFISLDNNGTIYPSDTELAAITRNPTVTITGDSDIQSILQYKYLSIIFIYWLATTWIEVKGHKYNVVVKTLENNSSEAFYFNDFQFNEKSKFHSDTDCRDIVSNFTIKEISVNELFKRIIEKYR